MTLAAHTECPCAYDASQTDESAGNYADVVSKTFTPQSPGTHYWVIRFDASTTAPATFSAITRLDVDGTPYSERHHENGGNWIGASGVVRLQLNQSSHTMKVQLKTSSAAQTASIKEVLLQARMACE